MHAGLRTLLKGILDYAGLFPPAQLPLDQAFRNFLRYRTEADAWMLAGFVCPASRLQELVPLLDDNPEPAPIAVLGKGGSGPDEFRFGLQADLEAFRALPADRFTVCSFETKLPEGLPGFAPPEIQLALQDAAKIAELAGARVFIECKLADSDQLMSLLSSIREHPKLAYKLRCGGATANDVPSVERVAVTLAACKATKAPLKFTAGLHHPLRHHNKSFGAPMHGFLNVFVAGVLARVHKLGASAIEEIIADEDASHFVFDAAGLAWQELRATNEEIESARRELVTTVGSCSFDEPRDDLRALDLLAVSEK